MANEEQEWKSPHNPWLITAAVMLAVFIFVLDSTIANVALPHMAGSFSASQDEAMWILTSYLIASGIILPSVAWFSNVFGRKAFFITCILIFTFASVLCGLSTSLDTMLVSRIIQGIGGGAMLPIAQAIMMESFPKEQRGVAMSIFALGVVTAPVIGPLLGGWITDNYSWNWIFFINLPFGLLAATLANSFIEDPPYAQKKGLQKIDYVGFGFLIVWLVSLQVVLDKGQNADWFNAQWICWLSVVSIISMICFVISQLKNKDSIIDLSIFRDRNFAIGSSLLMIVNAVLYSSIAIMPLFLQSLLGYTAYLSGFATMPRGVGSLTAVLFTAIAGHKLDARFLVTAGLSCIGISSLMFGFLSLDISMFNIVLPNVIMGFGLGLTIVPLTTLSLVTLDNHKMTNASGIQNLMKNIGGAIGTSIVNTLLIRNAQKHQFLMVGHLSPLNPVFKYKVASTQAALSTYMHATVAEQKANYLMYGELLKQSNLWSYIDAFRIFGILGLCIIPFLFLMKKPRFDKNASADMSALH
ncbi:MAG: DHA2 family efflux MFS transporter permease subunit [Candidatus Gastranaerophilales bacterium]|nr:DHA2 family efflux MFS transporter permease subunit [Candidatus Gastranaerophilales bacterium]